MGAHGTNAPRIFPGAVAFVAEAARGAWFRQLFRAAGGNLVLALIFVATALIAGCTPEASVPETQSTPARTATVAARPRTVGPVSTTPVPAMTLQAALNACAASAPPDAPSAASTIQSCLATSSIAVETNGVAGALPLVLVEQAQKPCQYDSFIASYEGGAWHARNITALFSAGAAERLLGPGFLGAGEAPRAIETGAGPALRLITLAGLGVCGSGPRTLPIIFAQSDGVWSVAWGPGDPLAGTPPPGSMLELSESGSRFSGTSGDVVVTGDAWGIADDPLAHVFFEAHAGPHRRVDQTWRRQGDGYVLASAATQPSAYNTLVQIIARLSLGDDAGAKQQLTRPGLIETAKTLQLTQKPLGQNWMIDFGRSFDATRGPIRIQAKAADHAGPPQSVIVVFEQRAGNWLIASFAAAS